VLRYVLWQSVCGWYRQTRLLLRRFRASVRLDTCYLCLRVVWLNTKLCYLLIMLICVRPVLTYIT